MNDEHQILQLTEWQILQLAETINTTISSMIILKLTEWQVIQLIKWNNNYYN
jgi:hypothetical protein